MIKNWQEYKLCQFPYIVFSSYDKYSIGVLIK